MSSSGDLEGLSTSSFSSGGRLQAGSAKAMPGKQGPRLGSSSASSSRPASRRKAGTGNSASVLGRPGKPAGTGAPPGPSAGSSSNSNGPAKLPMPKLDLKALFDYHSRMRQRRKRRRRGPRAEVAARRKRPEPHDKNPEPRAKRPRLKISQKERKRMFRERPPLFPFVEKLYGRKHIPVRMECLFEHATLQGFFKYIEMLKFEHHLKKSLAKLGAADDLEQEGLESRRHKYLDDDGPLSPIEETNGEDPDENGDAENIGARIVENSCFILSSRIPKKKQSKKKTQHSFE